METKLDINKVPEFKAGIDYIMREYHKGKAVEIMVYGPRGLGKSYVSMRIGELLCEKLGKKFTINNVSTGQYETVSFARERREDVLVNDEVGNLYNSRRAMSSDNVDINAIRDTIRKRKIIEIDNLPIPKTVDINIRSLASLMIEVIGLDKTRKINIVKPLVVQLNYQMGKVYYHRLQDGNGKDVTFAYLRKPSDELCIEYEKKKDIFIDKLYAKLQRKQEEKLKKEGQMDKPKANEEFSPQELKVYDLKYRQNKKPSVIATELGVSNERIYQVIKNLRLKAQFGIENNKEMTKPIGKSTKPINLISISRGNEK